MAAQTATQPIRCTAFVAATLALAILFSASAGSAQDETDAATAPPAPPTCDSEMHRQFDFWVGNWDVTQPDGTKVGENTIELILADCVLRESWTGGSGLTGHSFSLYARSKGKWHQTWVDSAGSLLEIEGGLVDGAMVLEGSGKTPTGAPVKHRVTWTPNDDGSVRQHWQTSTDGGKSWSDAFDGLYRKKKP